MLYYNLSLLLFFLDFDQPFLHVFSELLLAFKPLFDINSPFLSKLFSFLLYFLGLLNSASFLDFSLPLGSFPKVSHLFDFLDLHFVAAFDFGFLLLEEFDAILHLLKFFFCLLFQFVLVEHVNTMGLQDFLVINTLFSGLRAAADEGLVAQGA